MLKIRRFAPLAAALAVTAVGFSGPAAAAKIKPERKKVLEDAAKQEDGSHFLSVLKVLVNASPDLAVKWAMAAKEVAPDGVTRAQIMEVSGVAETEMVEAEKAAEMAKLPVPFFSWRRVEGKASLGVTQSNGNSEATAISAGLDMKRTQGRWEYGIELDYDRQSTDGSRSTNRFDAEPEVKFTFNHRAFWFALARYTMDQFDGFEYRIVASSGVGYKFADSERFKFSGKTGPGVTVQQPEQNPAAIDASDPFDDDLKTSLAAFIETDMSYAISETAKLENETDVVIDPDLDVRNKTALVLKVTESWSGQMSYEVRWNSDAPMGTKETDTITRISVGYGF